jgi:UPF0755 protein
MDYHAARYHSIALAKPVLIEIIKGDSLSQICHKLKNQQVDFKPFWFKFLAYYDNVAGQLKTGEYELPSGLTLPQIITLFAQGKTKHYSITFPEGWQFKDYLRALENIPQLEHRIDYSNNLKDVLQQLAIEQPHPEGLFFPDTYYFEKSTTDIALLKRAFGKMQEVLQQEWSQKAEGLPLKDPYEALILASIIEKETALPSERALIASVFLHRLKAKMLLQTDPAVIYGMGENFKGNIKAQDLKTVTPYNTYMVKGLPPSPIAMPGRDAIHAALHPDASNKLYFVARGDGSHVFSATLKEHNIAVYQFQKKKK